VFLTDKDDVSAHHRIPPPGDAANRSMDQRPKRRSRREFVTTLTEENAMAAAAIMGVEEPEGSQGNGTSRIGLAGRWLSGYPDRHEGD
jgi:hypothetical protein